MKIISNTKMVVKSHDILGKLHEYDLSPTVPCEVDSEVFNHLTFTYGNAMFTVTEEDKKEIIYPKIKIPDVVSVPTATVIEPKVEKKKGKPKE